MTHVTGGGLSPLHQQHSLSHLFIILELSAFMGGGEDRLQSPGDQGCLSGRLAARAISLAGWQPGPPLGSALLTGTLGSQ